MHERRSAITPNEHDARYFLIIKEFKFALYSIVKEEREEVGRHLEVRECYIVIMA
jgi:hypothetical protein